MHGQYIILHTVKHTCICTHVCIYMCVYMATHLRSPCTQVRILFAQSPLIAPLCPPHTHTHTRMLDLGLGLRVCVSVRRVLVIASACATSLLALAVFCVFEEKKAKEQLISATLTSRRDATLASHSALLCCCWGEVRAPSNELSWCLCVWWIKPCMYICIFNTPRWMCCKLIRNLIGNCRFLYIIS